MPRPKPSSLSVVEEHTFRCEDCDELFQSKLDLRRHKKYACTAVSSLYETLNDEIKQEGLGDGQVYECKDCERMFPNKYRYRKTARPCSGLPRSLPPVPAWPRMGNLGARGEQGGSGHCGSSPSLSP